MTSEHVLSPWQRAKPAEAAGHSHWADSRTEPEDEKWPISFHTTFCIMTLALLFCWYSLTVMICALSSGERVEAFGFPLNSLWNACMALAVTSYSQEHSRSSYYKLDFDDPRRWIKGILLGMFLCSHHMAECHHSQQSLTTGLDSSQRKCPHQLLQETQHMKCGGVLFAAWGGENISCNLVDKQRTTNYCLHRSENNKKVHTGAIRQYA